MKVLKRIGMVLVAYILVVVIFESLIGFFQPADQSTLVISVVDQAGEESDRVVSRLESDEMLYVAVNHWPRAWYKKALANPKINVTLEEGRGAYLAVPVVDDSAEYRRVDADNSLPLFFRVLTGFPPRHFLRLESREELPVPN